jgi:CelD/BcsL family acetyltransferase involved in cellulose biosynthesis
VNITIHPADRLDAASLQRWSQLCDDSPLWSHPFYRPEFTRLVSQARGAVFVAVIRDGDREVGFFPFERVTRRRGCAVGLGINDFQGVILAEGVTLDARRLLSACELSTLSYDHWLNEGTLADQHHESEHGSPFIDLRGGFDAYYQRRLRNGATRLKRARQTMRRLQREVGDVRIELEDRDSESWDKLWLWKRAQYERSGAIDVTRVPWIWQVLEQARQHQSETFAGRVMSLRAGDQTLAIHFGLQSRKRVHWWFPAYDVAFGRYSPGLLLLLEAARELAAIGCTRIDLGRGDEPYKGSVTLDHCLVGEGLLGSSELGRGWRRGCRQAVAVARTIPGHQILRGVRKQWDLLKTSR